MIRYFIPSIFVACLVALSATVVSAQTAEEIARGERTFKKCQACHGLTTAVKRVGPALGGVVGRKSASQPDFAYSTAMTHSGITWTEENIDKFITNPMQVVNGTKMTFPGLKDPSERAAVIAYLKANAQQVAQAPQSPGAPKAEPKAAPKGQPKAAQAPAASPTAPAVARGGDVPPGYNADVRYTLRTGIAEGRMVYLGVGGAIDGQVNPTLKAVAGQLVQVTLINGEGAMHDIVFPEINVASQYLTGRGASTTVAFRVRDSGTLSYYCSLPGHREAGMQGSITVAAAPEPSTIADAAPDIVYDPANVPPPITRKTPATVRVDLESTELDGRLADGTTYQYWTFNNTVPGPFLRVRVGDTVDVHFKNSKDAAMIHSVDFHAATGPGGGAAHLQVAPGDEGHITFKALVPGLYVYHCATPMVAHHIANGMYGMIYVEPEEPLPHVDHEFYVMQGEIYTQGKFGEHGSQEFSVDKLLDEKAEYVVFNGAVGALTTAHPLKAKVGETVRIFFGVGGPNYTSSFHVIGEIFDKVYAMGDVTSPPAKGVQTVSVPAGGATIVDFKLDVPGRFLLVDHALSRMERGLAGFLQVEGEPKPEIYQAHTMPAGNSGH